jgi:hypothetical protein
VPLARRGEVREPEVVLVTVVDVHGGEAVEID